MDTDSAAGATPTPYTAQHIKDALAQDPRVGEMTFEVTLAGGRAFVAGQVPTEQRRDAVPDVVRSVAPDLEVVNEVTVVPCDEPVGQEVIR
ncbi:MAG TPA: BON domain-containing protein [Egibacteraceae bacterium]|nr:BON domain-containing protein [Egibacteraceae bacterium]